MTELLNGIRGLVFDCDGVLFDSHPANLAYYNTVLTELGEPAIESDDHVSARLCHTACSRDVFTVLLGPERTEEALEIAGALDYRQFLSFLEPFDGMLDHLPRLAERYPMALATNRTTSVHVLLEHFGIRDLFSYVVTSSDVPRPKPSPDMLIRAAKDMGMSREELIFVGDAESDRIAAEQAGCRFVAFGNAVEGVPRVSRWSDFGAWMPGR